MATPAPQAGTKYESLKGLKAAIGLRWKADDRSKPFVPTAPLNSARYEPGPAESKVVPPFQPSADESFVQAYRHLVTRRAEKEQLVKKAWLAGMPAKRKLAAAARKIQDKREYS